MNLLTRFSSARENIRRSCACFFRLRSSYKWRDRFTNGATVLQWRDADDCGCKTLQSLRNCKITNALCDVHLVLSTAREWEIFEEKNCDADF
jgi:hypothetical protein